MVSTAADEVMAEVAAQPQGRVRIVLPRGRYRVIAREGRRAWLAEVTLRPSRAPTPPSRRRRSARSPPSWRSRRGCSWPRGTRWPSTSRWRGWGRVRSAARPSWASATSGGSPRSPSAPHQLRRDGRRRLRRAVFAAPLDADRIRVAAFPVRRLGPAPGTGDRRRWDRGADRRRPHALGIGADGVRCAGRRFAARALAGAPVPLERGAQLIRADGDLSVSPEIRASLGAVFGDDRHVFRFSAARAGTDSRGRR